MLRYRAWLATASACLVLGLFAVVSVQESRVDRTLEPSLDITGPPADPHDLDDAAYAAARYLCASGLDLASGSGWTTAVWSYNHSPPYIEVVRHAATVYAQRTS